MTIALSANQRERQRQLSRSRLLEAAVTAFADAGYEGASTHAIAKAAGLQQSLIVYHFGGKEGLWRAAVDAVWQRIDEALNAALPSDPQQLNAHWVRKGLQSYIRAVARHPEYLRILLREMAQPGPRLDWLVEHHTRRHSQRGMAFLEAVQQVGLVPKVPLVNLTYSIFGAIAIVIAGAPEVERATGVRPLSDLFLEQHVDTLMALLFPTIDSYQVDNNTAGGLSP